MSLTGRILFRIGATLNHKIVVSVELFSDQLFN